MTELDKERTERAGDPKVSAAYRGLGAEEPPSALDDAILAAARRRPQRWYAPLAAAAVLVLAVAVSLNMQLERPGIESPAPQAAPPAAEQPASQQELRLRAETKFGSVVKPPAKETGPARRKEGGQAAPVAPASPAVREPQPFAADSAAAAAAPRSDDARGVESSITGSLARQAEERTARDAEAAARAPRMGPIQAQAKRAERAQADLQAQNQADTPEREIERIAQLRAQGRHEEADRAFAEFRKRYPDYRISEEMRLRLERR